MRNVVAWEQIVILGIIIFFSGCVISSEKENKKNEIASVVSNLYGKSVLFHDSLILYIEGEPINGQQFVHELSERKIISVIEGNCSKCIQQFNKWIPFYNRLKSIGMENKLIFFVENVDPKFFMEYYHHDIPEEFILIFDEKDDFSRMNELPKNKMLKTFLVDSANRIIFVGNPLLGKRLMDYYYDEILKK